MFENQFQGTEYYCPTCEKIVRSGYQLEQTEEFHNEQLNRENNIFSDALEGIKPLLGLKCWKKNTICGGC